MNVYIKIDDILNTLNDIQFDLSMEDRFHLSVYITSLNQVIKELEKDYMDKSKEYYELANDNSNLIEKNNDLQKENQKLKKDYNLLDTTMESDDRIICKLLKEKEQLENNVQPNHILILEKHKPVCEKESSCDLTIKYEVLKDKDIIRVRNILTFEQIRMLVETGKTILSYSIYKLFKKNEIIKEIESLSGLKVRIEEIEHYEDNPTIMIIKRKKYEFKIYIKKGKDHNQIYYQLWNYDELIDEDASRYYKSFDEYIKLRIELHNLINEEIDILR